MRLERNCSDWLIYWLMTVLCFNSVSRELAYVPYHKGKLSKKAFETRLHGVSRIVSLEMDNWWMTRMVRYVSKIIVQFVRKVRNFAQLTNNISWQKIGVDPSPVCSGGCAGNQNLCCQIFAVVASSTKLFFQNMVILYTIEWHILCRFNFTEGSRHQNDKKKLCVNFWGNRYKISLIKKFFTVIKNCSDKVWHFLH